MATAPGGSDPVPCCPACGRRAASLRTTRCLFCGARFTPEIAERLDRLRQETHEEGSAELRRALLLGFGAAAAGGPAGRSAKRRRGLTLLLSVVLVLFLLIFGAGALFMLTGRGGIDVGGLVGSVRNLATFIGALAVAALVIGLAFLLGRRWAG